MADTGVTFNEYLQMGYVELPESLPLQKAISWVDLCITKFHKKQTPKQILILLVKLITTCSASQEFKNAINNKIQKIIYMCISVNDINDVESSLECLEIILIKYGIPAFLCKAKIATYLEKFLSSPSNVEIITKAGNAYHFLQQVGNAGKNGIAHKNQWTNYIQVLCKTMHKLYDSFFENVYDYNTSKNEIDAIPFAVVLDLADNKQIAQRLRNCIIFLKCAILKQYPGERNIPFYNILYVLKRGLTFDEYSDNSEETSEFLRLLYTLQINLLHLLKASIICTIPGIRKYSVVIVKILTDCLKRTDKEYFHTKSIFQSVLYSALNECITLERGHLNSESSNIILSYALKDITRVIHPNENDNRVEEIAQLDLSTNSVNQKITIANKKCIESIHTATNLLRNAVLLEEAKLKILYEFLVDRIIKVHNGRCVLPYPNYLSDLMKLLTSLCTIPNYCSEPLLNCTLQMLTTDERSLRDKIYSHGLEAIENLVCPIYPSLSFANSSTTLSNNANNTSHENSLLNVINALESGYNHSAPPENIDLNVSAESIQESISEDYISNRKAENIEPASKRSRRDDEIKTISISINHQPRLISEKETNTNCKRDNLSFSDTGISDRNQHTDCAIIHSEYVLNSAGLDTHVSSSNVEITDRNLQIERAILRSENDVLDNTCLATNNQVQNSEIIMLPDEQDSAIKKEEIKLDKSVNLLEDDDDDGMEFSSTFKDVPNQEFLDI